MSHCLHGRWQNDGWIKWMAQETPPEDFQSLPSWGEVNLARNALHKRSSEYNVAQDVTEGVRWGMGMHKGAVKPHGFREKLLEENDRKWALKDKLASAGVIGERVLCAEKKEQFSVPTRGFSPWVRKIPWKMKWQPTPVFLPGKSHGQRSPEGDSPWGLKG